jgi:hypothetical protein
MSVPAPVFDRHYLERAEHTYRQQLIAHPEDTELRVRLAWCLFMQALHQAGQETARGADATALESALDPLCERSSHALLKDCLQQTYTVMHVSIRSGDRPDVEKIQELVRLSGRQNLLIQAQDRAAYILARLTGEMLKISEANADQN